MRKKIGMQKGKGCAESSWAKHFQIEKIIVKETNGDTSIPTEHPKYGI
jgi:hypothetical protein